MPIKTKQQPNWWIQQRRRGWLRMGLLSFLAFIFALPIVWTLLASFGVQPTTPALAWTWPPVLEHYQEIGVADPNFWQALATTSLISALATGLAVTLALLAAYSLVRSRFAGRHLLLQSFLLLASLPVMAYIIPLSLITRWLHLQDSAPGLVLAQTAIYAPLATYVLFGYLARLPREVEEAAHLDGANLLRLLVAIIVPEATLGLAATAVIVFILQWNTFVAPLVLTNGAIKTLPLLMSDFFTFERELAWPTAAAALMTAVTPLLVLVALAHHTLTGFSFTSEEQASDP